MKNNSKDPIILNESNKIKTLCSKLENHSALTPDDFEEMKDIMYDLEFEVRNLHNYLFDTQDSMTGGFNGFKYELRPHEESEEQHG